MLEVILLFLGIVMIALIAEFFGLEQILSTLSNASLELVIAAIAVQVLLLTLTAARLVLITRRYGGLGFWKAFYISLVGMFVGNLSPLARLGGEPVKVYLMKDEISAEKGSAVIAVDLLAEVISLYIVVITFVYFLYRDIPSEISPAVLPFLVISVFLTLVFIKVCTNREWLGSAVNAIARIPKLKILKERGYAARFYSSFRELAADRKKMFAVLGVSVVMKFLELLRMWLVIVALGQLVSFKVVILIWIVFLVLSVVPWLPGGLGLVEGGMILALIQLGVAQGVASSAILLDRFISYWLIVITGFAGVWFNPAITYRFLRKLR